MCGCVYVKDGKRDLVCILLRPVECLSAGRALDVNVDGRSEN